MQKCACQPCRTLQMFKNCLNLLTMYFLNYISVSESGCPCACVSMWMSPMCMHVHGCVHIYICKQGCMYVLAMYPCLFIYEREIISGACLGVWAHDFVFEEDICDLEVVDSNLQMFVLMFPNRKFVNYEKENCD